MQPVQTNAFQQAYQQLNDAQRQAVDTIDGPVMVLAGPGTGKTQVLAVRIARILQETDTPPQAILALTFTEAAAANMRQRLVKLIGSAGYYVQISTFHAFCSSVIQQHPEYFPIERNSQSLTEIEKFQLFESLLLKTELVALKPLNRPLFYLSEVIRAISDLKREGVSPEQFSEIVAREVELLATTQEELSKTERAKQEKMISRWQELQLVYAAYQQQLTQKLRYDFDDMIMLTKTAFEHQPELLLDYQEKVHYFLVDEYQDTNSAQNAVVSQLASFWGEQANLFVVGDPHQAIYRFQGASVENALGFAQQYPQAAIIQLQTGYRCPQLVYDAAHQLISHNTVEGSISQELAAGLNTRLQAAQKVAPTSETEIATQNPSPIIITTSTNQVLELTTVLSTISQLLKSGADANQIAVLFRHNKDAAAIQELFTAAEIPYQLADGKNVLTTELISQLLTLLTALTSLNRGIIPDTFYEILKLNWFGLPAEIPMKLAVIAHQTKKSIWEVVSDQSSHQSTLAARYQLTELELEMARQVKEQLLRWTKSDANQVLPMTLQTIFEESGLLNWIKQQPQYLEFLQQLSTFFEYAQRLATQDHQTKLNDLVTQIQTMLAQNISLPLSSIKTDMAAVTLSTAHKAKGQEWDYVFVVHTIDGKWGNAQKRNLLPLPTSILSQAMSQNDANQDDRRLFYVAMTRAKKQLYVSYPEAIISEGRQQTTVPSIFMHEVQNGSYSPPITVGASVTASDELVAHIEQKVQPPPAPTTDGQQQLIKTLVDQLPISITALNTYLQDPQQFLEKVVLRVPRAKEEPLAFGSAVHSALELLGKTAQRDGQLPPVATVVRRFETALNQELLADDQMARRLVKGKELLENYYHWLENEALFDPNKVLFVERFFGSGAQTAYLGATKLVGRIDRVDWLNQAIGTAIVVDYKTGKPKSINEINGAVPSQPLSEREQSLPASIRGPLKRQLLFYKLLAELDPTFKPKVTEGVFSFLEPSPAGKLVERRFELLDQDVEDLKELIQQVVEEIKELAITI